MGGTSQRDREFIVRRVYRALRTEGLLDESKATAGSRPPVCIAENADIRHEILAFAEGKEPGPILNDVLNRLRDRR
jgi:hypothetical protein